MASNKELRNMSAERKTVKKKKRWGKVVEYNPVVRTMSIDEETMQEIQKELKNLKPITPESFANKHGIKVSLAREILRKHAEEGKIRQVIHGRRTEVYSK